LKLSPQHSFSTFFLLQSLPSGMLLTVIPFQAYALVAVWFCRYVPRQMR